MAVTTPKVTNTANQQEEAVAVILVDQTGAYVAAGGGAGGGGASTIANGADVAEGSTTDSAWDLAATNGTVISTLKATALRTAATATGIGTPADAAATTTDTTATSLIAQIKQVVVRLIAGNTNTANAATALGLPTDPAATTTDATATSAVAQLKQVAVRISGVTTALGTPLQAGGNVVATGNVADGVADAGNSLKVGGLYAGTGNITAFTAGQRVPAQFDPYGNLRAQLVGYPSTPLTTTTTALYPLSRVTSSNATAGSLATMNHLWSGSAGIPQAGDASGNSFAISKGGSSTATGQVSVTTTATQIVAARAGRQKVTITIHAATDLFVGGSGVTITTGFRLKGTDGASITLDTAAAVYGIIATGTLTVSQIELY